MAELPTSKKWRCFRWPLSMHMSILFSYQRRLFCYEFIRLCQTVGGKKIVLPLWTSKLNNTERRYKYRSVRRWAMRSFLFRNEDNHSQKLNKAAATQWRWLLALQVQRRAVKIYRPSIELLTLQTQCGQLLALQTQCGQLFALQIQCDNLLALRTQCDQLLALQTQCD